MAHCDKTGHLWVVTLPFTPDMAYQNKPQDGDLCKCGQYEWEKGKKRKV